MNCTSAGVLMEAGGWGLVRLGGTISFVNFNFLLSSAESEQTSRDIV